MQHGIKTAFNDYALMGGALAQAKADGATFAMEVRYDTYDNKKTVIDTSWALISVKGDTLRLAFQEAVNEMLASGRRGVGLNIDKVHNLLTGTILTDTGVCRAVMGAQCNV